MHDEVLYQRLLTLLAIPSGDGCWPWTGFREKTGYGRLYIDSRKTRAHRAMWTALNGPIPDGDVILHRCDNRSCCRPDHLRAGTRAENNRDRDAKGRTVTRRKQRFRALHTAKVDNADLWAEVCSPESHDFDGISIG